MRQVTIFDETTKIISTEWGDITYIEWLEKVKNNLGKECKIKIKVIKNKHFGMETKVAALFAKWSEENGKNTKRKSFRTS
jgi:hypothetical protein